MSRTTRRDDAAQAPIDSSASNPIMDHYLIFTARKFKNVMGAEGLTWEIAGIFQAPDATRACLKAMQETGHGTAFAVSGFAFGVDMAEVNDVTELGKKLDPLTRLERMGNALASRMGELASASQQQLPPGDDD